MRIRPGAKRGEWIFEAVAGWILGDDGQLTRDWSSDEHPETFPWDEIDPFTAALKDTPWEERLRTFGGRRQAWTVREEPEVRYGAGTIPRNRHSAGKSVAETIPPNRTNGKDRERRFPGIVGAAGERYSLNRFVSPAGG